MKLPLLAIALLLVSAGTLRASEPSTLELTDGRTLSGTTTAIADGKLTFRSAGRDVTVGLDEVARLVRLPLAPVVRESDGVVLSNGDMLEGDAVSLSRGTLVFDSVRMGRLEIEQKSLRAIFFARPLISPAGGGAAPAAEVLMNTGSRTPAELRWMDRDKLGLQSPLGALEVSKGDVAWVFLKTASPTADASHLRLLLTTGERVTGRLLALEKGKLTVEWNGRTVALDWELVRAVESPGRHMEYLSQLESKSQVETPTIGPAQKPAMDRNASGGPLQLAGATWDRGVGMRAASRVTWQLDGKWKRLRATVGLDKSAVASHGAIFRVLGDGKVLFEKTLKPGDEPVVLDVAVDGVRTLQLVLDAGPGAEIGDYGDWADARLVR